jgi:hypothetical protein
MDLKTNIKENKTTALPFFYAGPVKQVRITKDNIGQFKIIDNRTENIDFINDRKALERKMENYEKGIKDELTKKYSKRYDLTVLTYNQYIEPYHIVDGCHRIEAMRLMLKDGRIDGFTFWLIPANTIWLSSKEDAVRLNEMVNVELKKAGLPLWVKKFEHTIIDGKLTVWKNINIIDTGDINQPLQFGVDWNFNEGIDFAEDKELSELPKYGNLINNG